MTRPEPNKVVARFTDGALLRGTTHDFSPLRETFHINDPGGCRRGVALSSLQALYFVGDLNGDLPAGGEVPRRGRQTRCKEVTVTFNDGSQLRGLTMSFSRTRVGFFLFAGRSISESVKVFVVHAAVRHVKVREGLPYGRMPLFSH